MKITHSDNIATIIPAGFRYTIPRIPPSLNRFAGRKNHWEYRNQKQQWKDLVVLLCRKKPGMPYSRAVVTITYYFPDRTRRDPDNYNGKMILDGLVVAGIIRDDSFKCVRLVLRGEYDKQNPRTEIEITPHREA